MPSRKFRLTDAPQTTPTPVMAEFSRIARSEKSNVYYPQAR